MKRKFTLDFIQLFSAIVGGIIIGVLGLLWGVMMWVDTAFVIGELMPGYETGGALGGSLGIWLGSILGIYVANRFSHTTGTWWLSILLSGLGMTIILMSVAWKIPILNHPALFFVVPILTYVGWNLFSWVSE